MLFCLKEDFLVVVLSPLCYNNISIELKIKMVKTEIIIPIGN